MSAAGFLAAGLAALRAGCFVAFLAAGFFAAGRFATFLAVFFATGFRAAGFFATFLAVFFATVFLAVVLMTFFAAFFAAGFAAVRFAGARRAAAFFAAFFAGGMGTPRWGDRASGRGTLAVGSPVVPAQRQCVRPERSSGTVGYRTAVPFEPLPPFDLVALERAVLEQWREGDVFAESLRRRADAPEWVFYEGPPTANGRPGLHHAWARLFKDIYPRFQTMRGHLVRRQGGWDCHGLPVEVEVEKELGFSGKQQIEAYGIAEFNERCRASVQRYVDDFATLTERIGMWLDTEGAYWTMSNGFIESVWWLFHEMWERGDIYEGFKVVPYCGRCGTALSSHELGQPGAYRDITEDSVYVRFPVVDAVFDLLVWTTTPWTLLSNVGVAIGPDIPYVRVRGAAGTRDLVLAADRVEAVLGEGVEVVGPVDASNLVGLRYEQIGRAHV